VVPRKIELGDALAALGALLVLVALFLEWFGRLSAWEAFEALDLVLALLALAALAAVAGVFEWLGPRALAPLGLALLVVVLVQVVEPPPAVSGDVDTGAWLALAGAALVLVGGALRVARVSITVDVGGRDARRRVDAVDRRQAAERPTAGPIAPAPGRPAPEDDPTQPTQPFSALPDPPER
jgi:hypothetical protein